jgi:hypothetical protein
MVSKASHDKWFEIEKTLQQNLSEHWFGDCGKTPDVSPKISL